MLHCVLESASAAGSLTLHSLAPPVPRLTTGTEVCLGSTSGPLFAKQAPLLLLQSVKQDQAYTLRPLVMLLAMSCFCASMTLSAVGREQVPYKIS